MNVNVLVVTLWVALGIATLSLAVYRRFLSVHSENDVLHLGAGEDAEIPRQVSLAQRLDVIDRWGKTMTVITLVIGLGIGVMYLYQLIENPNAGPNIFYGNHSGK
jgi:ABC-type Fe3+-siderophore transport system permease subunit